MDKSDKAAIESLQKLISDLDSVNSLKDEYLWRVKAIERINKFIGENLFTKHLKEFIMARVEYKYFGGDGYSRDPVKTPYHVFEPTKKAEAKKIIEDVIEQISINGIDKPNVTYDNPFTGMSFTAKKWFWGGVATYTLSIGAIIFYIGQWSASGAIQELKDEVHHLRDSISIVNSIKKTDPSVFDPSVFEGKHQGPTQAEKDKMEENAMRTADSIAKEIKKGEK